MITLLLILSTAALALGGLLVIVAGLLPDLDKLHVGLSDWYRTNHICGWCKAHLRGNPFSTRTSHGMCRACAAKMRAELKRLSHE